MKPIPAPSIHGESRAPNASELIKSTPVGFSNINRRSPHASVNQAYPWLLFISTAVAVFFALMYINKEPVIIAGEPSAELDAAAQLESNSEDTVITDQALLPPTDILPGEGKASTATEAAAAQPAPQLIATAPIHSRFEETNMRVQHILSANSSDGHVSRIDLEVPVIYESRQLRWSPVEVAKAEHLMVQLMDYQDKSRKLKSQGQLLLSEWNALIQQSIPSAKLRADSPSIPANQHASASLIQTTEHDTNNAVEIDSKEDQP